MRPAEVAIAVAIAIVVLAAVAGQRQAEPSHPRPPGTAYYRVQPGDTLAAVARRFDTSVAVLQQINRLPDPNRLTPGQTLLVPEPPQPAGGEGPSLADAGGPGLGVPERAVAGRDERPLSDLDLLARIIYLEARGEPFEGQVAVGAVVLNRVKSPLFPDTVEGVLAQPGQFFFTMEFIRQTVPNETAYRAAERALAGEDPTGGALFFYNPERTKTPEFWAGRPVLRRIGRHVFTL